MNKFLLNKRKIIVGMIHTSALPATPKYKYNNQNIIDKAINEAAIYKKSGIDALIIENMHDIPYVNKHIGHEISSLLSIIAYEIKKKYQLPTGIQILAGANKAALAVAHAANLDFIRAEGFVFSHIADEGMMNSDAGDLLRYRKQIGAEHVKIFTDIKKKHSSHAITNDISIVETAKAAEFFLSDGLIITGNATGKEANITDIKDVIKSTKLPVFIGSGINDQNFEKFFNLADGFIIGSYFKKDGYWENDLDEDRVKKIMKLVNKLKTN